jgi:adenylylsulfate kinase-like enzyme
MKTPWALLLTGLPNSGKSTLAYTLIQSRIRNALVIDGDKHREMQFLGRELGFSKQDIMENNAHVIKVGQFVQEQNMNVVIAQIAPFVDQRKRLRNSLQNYLEVYCCCPDSIRKERPNFKDSELVYEEGGYDLVLNTHLLTIEECLNKIFKYCKGGL